MIGSRHTVILVGILIATAALPALAQSRSERARAIQKLLPTPGKVIIEGSYPATIENVGDEETAKFEILEVEGRDFARVTQVDVIKKPKEIWQAQLHTRANSAAVKKGDVLIYAFDARMISSKREGGQGWMYTQLQRNQEPYDSFAGLEWDITKDWKTFYLTATAVQDWEENRFTLGLHLGRYEQKLEVG
jgi:hypothetical protein